MTKQRKSHSMLMTQGNIWRIVISFALPLLIGNIFQQLYNTVDSIVVGNYVGDEALAAVGSSSSLINLLVGFFTGIATGAGVLIARYYGAKNEEKVQIAVHTSIVLSIAAGIFLIFAGIICSPFILRVMGTPEDVMDNSVIYLRIFFLGSLFNVLYNMGSGILRAVGDSKHPLYYLCAASLVNIVLDLFFVAVLKMNIEGVAIATVIAQGVSAVLVIRRLMMVEDSYRLSLKSMKLHLDMAKQIASLGIPSGLQSSIISFSNVVVQANINAFGKKAVAGCGSYSKIDGFVLLPVMSFSMAAMTFVGQNIGARKYDRVKKGIIVTIVMSCIYIGIISLFLMQYGWSILKIFSADLEVNQFGYLMLSILIPFYIPISILNVLTSAFRGAGKSMAAMAIMILNLCVVRMLWVNLMILQFPRLETVLWGYPVSWLTGLVCALLYAWKGKWLENKIN